MPLRVHLAFGRGCFFMDPNPKMMEFVNKYKKARGAYPDSWAVMAYDSIYLLKAAIEKAKSVDTEQGHQGHGRDDPGQLEGEVLHSTLRPYGYCPLLSGCHCQRSQISL